VLSKGAKAFHMPEIQRAGAMRTKDLARENLQHRVEVAGDPAILSRLK
jgi:hypothetical protein